MVFVVLSLLEVSVNVSLQNLCRPLGSLHFSAALYIRKYKIKVIFSTFVILINVRTHL